MWFPNWFTPNLHFYNRRMELLIEETIPRIIVRQRWKIDPLKSFGVGLHTLEKFKKDVEYSIKVIWDNQLKLTPVGYSSFAQKNRGKIFPVYFEIEWVHEAEHWLVKLNPKGTRSSVNFRDGVIDLDLEDCENVIKRPSLHPGIYQIPVSHEFGHTIGARDEYYDDREIKEGTKELRAYWRNINKKREPFIKDVHSVMNIGDVARTRHFEFIIYQLNLLMLGTSFQPYERS